VRILILLLLLAAPTIAQSPTPQLPSTDRIRVGEFYRLAAAVQDEIWPGWSTLPAPLLLVTPDTEFLTHHPSPPKEMKKIADDLYARPRQFPVTLQATFPAFGPPAVMVVGQPAHTESKTSTAWLFMAMHEHFHQLQNGQPGYFDAVEALGLSHGDKSGMWMLNYPFPYEKSEVAQAFNRLRDLLLSALHEPDTQAFDQLAKQYFEQRKKFFALLSEDDRKYLSFQLWQEGIARYTEIKAAEAAAHYRPTAEYAGLSDYEPFSDYAAKKRASTLDELRRVDLPSWKRTAVYSFGASEGLLLDRINPRWKEEYFHHMLSMAVYFESAQKQ
jgi:hypothetical protein